MTNNLLTTLACIALSTSLVFSHEGDLDSYGGHYVWDDTETIQLGYHLHRDTRVTDKRLLSDLNKLSRQLQKQKKYEEAAMVRYQMNDIRAAMKYLRWAARADKNRRLIIQDKRRAIQDMVRKNG